MARFWTWIVLHLAVLLVLLAERGLVVGVVAEVKAEDDEGVPLTSLTDEQVDSALGSMDTATLTQIIESQGYAVEEGATQAQVLDAAKILVKHERDRLLKEGDEAEKKKTGANKSSISSSSSSAEEDDGVLDKRAPESRVHVANGSGSRTAAQASVIASDDEVRDDTTQANKQKQGVKGWNHTKPLPENATFWELFGSQVASDFGPIWRVIPEPLRMAFEQHSKVMGKPLRQAVVGAVGPMLQVASKVLTVTGRFLITLGGEASLLSRRISTMPQSSSDKKVESNATSYVDDNTEEEEDDADIIEI